MKMFITNFFKRKKKPFKVKVKCSKCGNKFFIYDDFKNVKKERFVGFPKDDITPLYSTICPYCLYMVFLQYMDCKKIHLHCNLNGITLPENAEYFIRNIIRELYR